MPGFHHPDDQPDSIIISVQSPGRAPGGPTVPVAGWPGPWVVFPKLLTLFRNGLPQSTFDVTGYTAPNLSVLGPADGYSDVAMLAGDILADRDSAQYVIELQKYVCNLGIDAKTIGGAKGDGTTDDAAALRLAIAAKGGGRIVLPPGTFILGSTVASPAMTSIEGWGRSLTTIKAAPGFAGPLVTLSSFGSRLENLTVDSNHVVNSVGASSNNINEQSGCRDVCFVNFQRAGLVVDGTGSPLFPQGWSLESCEFFLDAGTTYSSPSCVELTLTFPGKFDTCTFNSTLAGTVPPNSAGTRLGTNAGAMKHDNIHVENLATGIAGLSYGCVVDHFTVGPNVTTGIAVATGANNFAIIGATPSGSVANTVVDPDRGWSSGDVAVTDYVISAGGTLPQQTWINATAGGTSQFPNINVTQGGVINGPLCFTNDATSPNILAINSVSYSGDSQGGFISVNTKAGPFPIWFQTSTSSYHGAMWLRLAASLFEIRFGNAGNSQGTNPGTLAFSVTAAGVTVPTRLITAASATTAAGLSIPPGVAPTSPVDGDVWTTTAGVFARINGSTVGPLGTGGGGFTGTYTPHSAFGGAAVVDGTSLVPGTSFPVPLGTVLEVSEHITATRYAGIGNYLEYSPAADGGILRANATSLWLDAANTHAVTLLIGQDMIVTLGGSGNIVEADGLETIVDNYSTGTVNIIKAIGAETWHETSGTLTKGYGLYAFVGNFGSGTVTHGSAIFVDTPANTGGGAITTCCGIEIANQTVGTTGYAIKTGLGPVLFGDNVTVAPPTGVVAADLKAASNANALNLRDSTNAIRTSFDKDGYGLPEKMSFLLGQGVNLANGTYPTGGVGAIASDAGKLWKWKLRAAINPSGGAGGFSFDIKKNGTTVLSAPIAVAANTTTLQAGSTFSVPAVAEGDEFTVTITGAGTGVQNVSLFVYSLVRNG